MRTGYYLDDAFRPAWRGFLMDILNKNFVWLQLCMPYLALVLYCASKQSESIGPGVQSNDAVLYLTKIMALRLFYVCATTWQVYASDWLHNLDMKFARMDGIASSIALKEVADETARSSRQEMKKKASVAVELNCFGNDMISISAAMTSSLLLWSDNLGWGDKLVPCGLLMTSLTGSVFVLKKRCMVLPISPWKDGKAVKEHCRVAEMLIKGALAAQFFGLLMYMAYVAMQSNDLQEAAVVWVVYFPGFIFFGLKKAVPSTGLWSFGPHEFFHIFVILGHVATIIFDARWWLSKIE